LWLVFPEIEVLNRAGKYSHELGPFVEEVQSNQQQRSLVVEVPNIVEKRKPTAVLLDIVQVDILALFLIYQLFEFINLKCSPRYRISLVVIKGCSD